MMLLISWYVLISASFDISQYDVLQCIFCCIMDLYFVINNILYSSGMMMIHFLTWQTKVFLSYFQHFYFPPHKQLRITQYIHISCPVPL